MKRLAFFVFPLLLSGPALSAGNLTNGLPLAGAAPYQSTIPLTGNELAPFDTQLPGGRQPQSEAVSVSQLAAYLNSNLGLGVPTVWINGGPTGVLNLSTASNTSISLAPASGNAAAVTAFNEKITAHGSGNCKTGCSFNQLNVGGDTLDARDGSGNVTNAHAFLFTHTAGGTGSGSTMHGNRGTLSSTFFLSSTSGNLPGDGASYSGGDIEATASVNDNGTAPTLGNYAGQIEALHVQGILKGTATAFGALQGAEIDVTAATGTSMYKKTALELTQLASDQVQGSTIDAALIIGNSVGAVGWNEGISFGGQSIWPMATGGTLIGCSQLNGCGTVATGIDFSTATFTTAALSLPGAMKVLGDGTTIFAGPFHGSSGSAVPTCDAAHARGEVVVSDAATSPTYGGSYSSGAGAVTWPVFCDGGGTWKYH